MLFPPPQLPLPDPVFFDPFKKPTTLSGYNKTRRWRTWQECDQKYQNPLLETPYNAWSEPDEDLEPYRGDAHSPPPATRDSQATSVTFSNSPRSSQRLRHDATKVESGMERYPPDARPAEQERECKPVALDCRNRSVKAPAHAPSIEESLKPSYGDESGCVVATSGPLSSTDQPYIDLDIFECASSDGTPPEIRVNMFGVSWLAAFHDCSPAYPAENRKFISPYGAQAMQKSSSLQNWSKQEICSCRSIDEEVPDRAVIVRLPGKSEARVSDNVDLDVGWDIDVWPGSRYGSSNQSPAMLKQPAVKKRRKAASSAAMRRDGWGSSGDTLTGGSSEQWADFGAYERNLPELMPHKGKDQGSITSASAADEYLDVSFELSAAASSDDKGDWSFSDIPSTAGSVSPPHSTAGSASYPGRPLASFAPILPPVFVEHARQPAKAKGAVKEHSSRTMLRDQSKMLRQYSSMAVEIARDPWLAADTQAAMRANIFVNSRQEVQLDQQPSALQTMTAVESSPSVRSNASSSARSRRSIRRSLPPGTVTPFAARSAQNRASIAAIEPNGRAEELLERRTSSEHDDLRSSGSSSSDVPALTRPTSPLSKAHAAKIASARPKPLMNDMYCTKCRRHFANSHRLLAHMQDSVLHPYYCRSCTIDWPTFGELHMVRHNMQLRSC